MAENGSQRSEQPQNVLPKLFRVVIAFDVLLSGSVKVFADKCSVPKFCFSSFSLKQMSKRYKVSKMCVLSTVAIAHGLLALVVLWQLHLQSEHLIADTQQYSFQLPARESRMSSVQSVTQRKRTQFYQNEDNNVRAIPRATHTASSRNVEKR